MRHYPAGMTSNSYAQNLTYQTESQNYDNKSTNSQDDDDYLFKFNRQKNQHSEFY